MEFDFIEMIRKKVPKYTKYCFISGMIVGLLTHFYMLTHKLPNWDDLNNISKAGSGDYLGRWFLKYIHPLGSIYSIPAVHGVLFILCLSLAACFVLEIAQISSTTGAILVPTIMVTFTSVACTMTFMFMAHTSGIAILMACASVYFIRKYKYGFIPGIILILCTLGTYQSYVSIVITLMLVGLLVDIISDRKNSVDIIKNGVVYVVILVATVIVYMRLCHIINPNMDNETYGGVGSMGKIVIADVPILIGRCYKRFLEFFLWKPFPFMTRTSQMMNICTFVLAIVLFVYLINTKKVYKEPLRLFLTVLISGFIPLASAFIYFMAPEVDYSMLMLYAYSFIYVLVLALLEICIKSWDTVEQKWKSCLRQSVVLATVFVIVCSCYTDYLVTNKAYMRTDIAFERVSNYFNRMIAVIEGTEGYQDGEPVTIVGNTYYKENPSSVEFDVMDSEDLREMSGVALENGLLTAGSRDNFIRFYVGFNMADLSVEEKQALEKLPECREMPAYPTDGCVKKINGIWVLKMCE